MAARRSFWYSIVGVKELDKEEYVRMTRRIGIFVVLALAGSFAVFGAIGLFGNIQKVLQVVAGSDLYIYALAFAAVFVNFLVRYGKWTYYMGRLKLRVSKVKNFVVYMSVYSMDITPGKIGRVFAAYTLSRITKIKIPHIIPVVTMDIFTDFLGSALLALLASLYLDKYVLYVIAIDAVLLIPFVFILSDWAFKRIKSGLRKGRFLRLFSIYGDEYYASQSKLNTPKVYLVSVLFTLPAEFLNSLALYFTLRSLHIVPSLSQSVFAYSTSLVFGMISSLPGGIGVTDGTLVALLNSVYDLGPAISSAATIMARAALLWFGVALGTVFLLYSLRYWNQPQKKKKK